MKAMEHARRRADPHLLRRLRDAERAIDAAAALFGPRHAVVLNVAPAMTFAEGMAATSSLVPGSAFEDLNKAEALRRAEAGAARARRAGLDAEARATIAPTTWQGIVDVADELDAAVIVIGSRGLERPPRVRPRQRLARRGHARAATGADRAAAPDSGLT